MATDIIDRYYEEHSVYKSLIICEDESTAIELVTALREKDYTVTAILDDDIHDDRPRFMSVLQNWGVDMERVLVTTYYVIFNQQRLFKLYVLPDQNLIVFYNLDHNMSRVIVQYLEDCERSGFMESVNILSV